MPSPIDPPKGCSFHPRCPNATEECRSVDPPLEQVEGATEGHQTACVHVTEFEPETGIATEEVAVDERYSIDSFAHANRVDGNADD